MPPIAIRRYLRSDLDTVIAIFQGAVREVASKDYNAQQIAAWSAVDRAEWDEWRLTRPTWIAEIGGAAAGFTDLEPDGHLDMMFVHPAFQGRGVASALLTKVETEARALALARIHAESSITARPFFERRGFLVLRSDEVGTNGQCFTIYRVEKELV